MRTYLRLEILRMASDKRFLILMLAMPVAMYLLFTNLFGAANNRPTNGLTPDLAVMISMAAFGACSWVLVPGWLARGISRDGRPTTDSFPCR